MMLAPTSELARALAADPGAVIEEAATAHGATPRKVVEALPAIPSPPSFSHIPYPLGRCDADRVHTDDGIMEFTGPIPAGQVGRGYFDLMGRTGFHGHLRHERCGGLAFVERPFMGVCPR